MTAPMRIDVWSDIVCPWCAIGRKRLADALAQTGIEAEVVHRAFELDPTQVTAEPALQVLERKYGPQAGDMMDRVRQLGAAEGLDLRTREAVSTNTFDAHRLVLLAARVGRGEAMLDRLVQGHFAQALDVGDPATLVRLAREVGIPDAARDLEGNAEAQTVREDEEMALQLGVRGVPFFVLDGRLGITGAQPAEVFVAALRQAEATRPTQG